MKRKPSSTWTKKLNKDGLQFLTGIRYAKLAGKEFKDPEKVRSLVTNVLPKLFPGFAQGRSVVITIELLEQLKAIGMPMGDVLPGEHKLPENLARLVENFQMFQELINEAELRKALPGVAAFALMVAQDVYSDIALHKFGTRELNADQGFWTAGATLEWFGKMLKERKPVPITVGKGRENVELLELIRQIRAHQVEKLKPTELKQALEYAGYHVSDEEALRLFEWRAKKKGQL